MPYFTHSQKWALPSKNALKNMTATTALEMMPMMIPGTLAILFSDKSPNSSCLHHPAAVISGKDVPRRKRGMLWKINDFSGMADGSVLPEW
jgi:hypothetical protein